VVEALFFFDGGSDVPRKEGVAYTLCYSQGFL
jgi:hypothetical protein